MAIIGIFSVYLSESHIYLLAFILSENYSACTMRKIGRLMRTGCLVGPLNKFSPDVLESRIGILP